MFAVGSPDSVWLDSVIATKVAMCRVYITGLELGTLAVVPATLPLSYALKPKSLARIVFGTDSIRSSLICFLNYKRSGSSTHLAPRVPPNLLG